MQAQAWSIPFPRKERAGKKKPAHKRSGRRPAAAPAAAAGTRRPLPPWNSSTTDLDKHKLTAAELVSRTCSAAQSELWKETGKVRSTPSAMLAPPSSCSPSASRCDRAATASTAGQTTASSKLRRQPQSRQAVAFLRPWCGQVTAVAGFLMAATPARQKRMQPNKQALLHLIRITMAAARWQACRNSWQSCSVGMVCTAFRRHRRQHPWPPSASLQSCKPWQLQLPPRKEKMA